jgi:transcriptional regulator with XRE-family HTH domain
VPPKRRIIRTGLPDKERAVCARLREVRQHLRLTQTEFAVQIGISRERLASYEDARAPVRADVALRACHQFVVSEKWLAKGFGFAKSRPVPFAALQARLSMDLMREFQPDQFKARQSYCAAYEAFFGARYEQLDESMKNRGLFPLPRIVWDVGDDAMAFKNALAFFVDIWSSMLDGDEQKRLLAAIMKASTIEYRELSAQVDSKGQLTEFEKTLLAIERGKFGDDEAGDDWFWGYKVVPAAPGEMVPLPSGVKDSQKEVLRRVTPARNMAGMTEIAFLLQRLKRALEGVRKGDLARSLKVPLPRVSEWLSGRVMPSGETALRLLRWVEQREQKLNALGGAINTTKGKTQLRSSKVYEKTKSNPQEG